MLFRKDKGGRKMKIQLDCLPCLLRQALAAARLADAAADVPARILDRVLPLLADYRQYRCPPDLFRAIQQVIRELTGCADPYAAVKRQDIQAAQRILPQLQRFLAEKGNSLAWALRIAAIGNILDSAVYESVDLGSCLERELSQAFAIFDLDVFQSRLQDAGNLLIIGDNAGEAVLDQVLIANLAPREVTYALRSQPASNDATLADARTAGLDSCARLISSGCPAPGIILTDCRAEFLDIFRRADLVISKGQGNYEGLSGTGIQREVFCLLKAKCPVIARAFAVQLDSYIFQLQTWHSG
jgi:damage-control phosphatase, subfamily I